MNPCSEVALDILYVDVIVRNFVADDSVLMTMNSISIAEFLDSHGVPEDAESQINGAKRETIWSWYALQLRWIEDEERLFDHPDFEPV